MNWSFLHICDLQPGSPRSFRFHKKYRENWENALGQLREEREAELVTVGGDLTRDGFHHQFELELAREELNSLPFPWHAVPGNMDVGNKCADRSGGTGRDDPALNMTSNTLRRFAQVLGDFPWSFQHRNVRFSGCYEAVAGSGLPEEERFWHWLEEELPALPGSPLHFMVLHYPLFIHEPDEPDWDLTVADQYHDWYFSLNSPHRQRILDGLKQAGVTDVVSGHIHCRRPVQEFDGIRYYKCPAICFPQWPDKWPDGDASLGYYRFHVTKHSMKPEFVPLRNISQSTEGYGKGGHPGAVERDYSQAWEKGEIY